MSAALPLNSEIPDDATSDSIEEQGQSTQPSLQQQQQQQIEIDSVESDTDSTYSTDNASSFLTSIPSEVTKHIFENGRRYHSYMEGRYAFPNDAGEREREELKHFLTVLLTRGEFHLAPIRSDPHKILDIGTGFGDWAIEMAQMYPSAEVIGTDLSAVQPVWVPPNLTFEIEDAEDQNGWPYQTDNFDFVHIRYLASGIRDWPRLLEQAYRTTKPGGWIEVCEFNIELKSDDGSIPKNSKMCEWLDYNKQVWAKLGLEASITDKLRTLVIDAGFENVREQVFKLPMGPWPKDRYLKKIGYLQREQIKNGASGISMALYTRFLGWTPLEVEAYLVDVRKEMMDPTIHSYLRTFFVYGQKPMPV